MRNLVIILRMTNSCNLNCTYCYDKKNHLKIRNESHRVKENIENMKQYIKKLNPNEKERSRIIFHGGEPLLINATVYEELIKSIKEILPNAQFSIQTNGTLITKENIEVFKRYNVSVGISIDGYNEEQNYCRIYKNGNNSFKVVMKKIKKIQESGLNLRYYNDIV